MATLGQTDMDERLDILILEDNPSDAELIQRELRKAGLEFTACWVTDRSGFLQALAAAAPALVLADYSLPGFDGLTALHLAKERFQDMPVVIVSGAVGEETAIEAVKAGATDYVLKQRLNRLGPVVRRALQESRQAAEKKIVEQEVKQTNEKLRKLAAELQAANTSLRDSRVAALNLMKDAVEARKHTEKINEELQREVAERKLAEESLGQSEEQTRRINELLEAVTNGTELIVATVDRNLRYTFFNEAYKEEIKRLSGGKIRIGWSLDEIFGHMPEQRDVAIKEWNRTLAGEGHSYRIEFGEPGDHQRVYNVRRTPIRNSKGDVVGAGEVAFDVTEQVRAEKALDWSARRNELLSATAARLLATDKPQTLVEELCSRIMEFLDCHVFFNFLVDPLLRMEQGGQAMRLRLNACAGIPDGEAKKIEWLDYGVAVCGCVARDGKRIIAEDIMNTPDPRTELVKSYGIQAYCCHPLTIERRLIGTLSFGTRSRPRFSADDVAVMKTVSDMVAMAMMRMLDERVVRESRQDLNRAQVVSHTGSWRLNVQRNELLWSDENWRIFGIPTGTPLTYETFLGAVHPDDRAYVDEKWSAGLRGEPYDIEHRIVVGDTVKWVRERAELEFDKAGVLLGGFGTTQDITERKRIEHRLRRAAEELARSNKDLEQFAYVTSHDLKEPLRMVTGFMGLLKDRFQGKLDSKADEYIGFAADAATRMQGLVDDLLAYSRVGRNDFVESTDVKAVLDRVLEDLRAGIEESGTRITRDAMPTVQANALELTQVFQNLIGNAIKFRREGVAPEVHIGARRMSEEESGRVGAWTHGSPNKEAKEYRAGDTKQASAESSSPETRTSAPSGVPVWLFTVQDNGIGIDPQFSERIFMIFQRLHTREEYPGTGVGLAICKKIVERRGGGIWVESQEGKGATFCFTVPV